MPLKDNEIWDINADFWDKKMGENSNDFHRNVVRPATDKLLSPKNGDFILDISCGNGNFSKWMAHHGAKVVAFDFSEKLIEIAKSRCSEYHSDIEFCVADATDEQSLLSLKREKPFNKAVSNMALMDISNIKPLFKIVSELLKKDGIFVFTTTHPCFDRPKEKYLTSCSYKGIAIDGQPVLQNYYHRSLEEILNIAFKAGFCVDGFLETPFKEKEIPSVITVRLKKS